MFHEAPSKAKLMAMFFGALRGIFLNEWKGVKSKTIMGLIIGILALILSTFVD